MLSPLQAKSEDHSKVCLSNVVVSFLASVRVIGSAGANGFFGVIAELAVS